MGCECEKCQEMDGVIEELGALVEGAWEDSNLAVSEMNRVLMVVVSKFTERRLEVLEGEVVKRN